MTAAQSTSAAPPPVDRALLDFATELVLEAGAYTLEWFRSIELDVEHKDDGSPVTVADRRTERLMRERIAARYPDDAVMGEEEDDTAGSSGRGWVIDPIDGTKAFTHGVGLYSNLLYVHDEHGPAVGIIGIPALGEIVAAGRGLGCYLNGAQCQVSDTTTAKGAILSTCAFDDWDAAMLGRVHASGLQMRTWGDGYGYALVATGRIDAMVDPVVNYWDIAPCQVIIPEAGGRFTAIDGTDDVHHGTGIATNGLIHDEVVRILTNP